MSVKKTLETEKHQTQKQKQQQEEEQQIGTGLSGFVQYFISIFVRSTAARQFYCNVTQFHAIFEILIGLSLIKRPESLYSFNNDIYSKDGIYIYIYIYMNNPWH